MTGTEGTAAFTVTYQGAKETHQTWYKIVTPPRPDNGRKPLIVLHGGPGCTHDYLLSLADLAAGDDGRTVIFYDQIGNGRSTHLPDRGAEFWTPQLFVDELYNLIRHLNIGDGGYHILGQSWGGFLAQEFALTQPAGLHAIVLANTASSWRGFQEECDKLRALLPDDVQAVLTRHEAAGTYDDPEYKQACEVFYDRHVCRAKPLPPDVKATFDALDADPTVYRTMNGPTEFLCIGSAVGWNVTGRLGEIGNGTLIVSGRHDEAGLPLQVTLLNGLPHAELTVFGDSSHMPHWEERARYMQVVGGWLGRQD